MQPRPPEVRQADPPLQPHDSPAIEEYNSWVGAKLTVQALRLQLSAALLRLALKHSKPDSHRTP